MKKTRNISFLLALAPLIFYATLTKAQVTATATVTLTVVSAAGMNFTPASKLKTTSSIIRCGAASENQGVTFCSSENAMVQLNSSSSNPIKLDLQEGQVRTFSAGELKKVSSVEIIYLGS